MVKKFFAAMILAFALVVAGQTSTAEAGEVYVGSYSDGTAVYLLTHTVQRRSESAASVHEDGGGGYVCTVRAGGDYLDYTFTLSAARGWQYRNSEGYHGYVYDGSSPVAASICDYLRNNY